VKLWQSLLRSTDAAGWASGSNFGKRHWRVLERRLGLLLKVFSGTMVILLMAGVLAGALRTEPVMADSGTIYIRTDGTVEGTDSIHTADNVTYVFALDINASIVVQRNNVIIDGKGHMLQGPYPGQPESVGIDLSERTNVTIRDTQINAFDYGISLNHSSNNIISGNIMADFCCISLSSSSNNTISRNDLPWGFLWGILLVSSSDNIISGNNIAQSYDRNGILLSSSSNNTISGNNVTNNGNGIELHSSSGNTISGNNVTDNSYGIWFDSCSNNMISGNNMTNNGIELHSSSGNTISGNNFIGGAGISVDNSFENTVQNNLVNGKLLVYLENASDIAVDNAGQVILVNCENVTVKNLELSGGPSGLELWGTNNSRITNNTISGNGEGVNLVYSSENVISGNSLAGNGYGIFLHSSSNNTIHGNSMTANNPASIALDFSSNNIISGNNVTNSWVSILLYSASDNTFYENNITNNEEGICISLSSDNTFYENNISANSEYGMYFTFASNNTVYHNSFVNNGAQVVSSGTVNSWDDGYPSGGNYWNDCTGVDEKSGFNQGLPRSDGKVDTPYVIDSNNSDHYPLIKPYTSPVGHDVEVFDVVAAKTVIGKGFSGNITVYIVNKGAYAETFNVTAYANDTAIGTQQVTNVDPTEETALAFTLNANSLVKGKYNISAYAGPVLGETDTADNRLEDGLVTIAMRGDINADGIVNVIDVSIVARAFGTHPGYAKYNPNADVNDDGATSILDISLVAREFGKKDQ
jgi:parallel beta-helix repeat protein